MHYNGYNRFFIVGAMRSGTTYLATVLDEHPEISMAKPLIPEPKFFLNEEEFEKGMEFYRVKYFRESGNAKVFGEKTVHYSEREDALKRIKEIYPECKIIMILRNPIPRAVSNYYFSFKNGLDTRTIEDVFLNNVQPPLCKKKMYISPFAYLERSTYINQIKLIEKYFNREKFKIITEDLFGKIAQIQETYKFLKISDDFIPASINKKIYSNNVYIKENINPDIILKLKKYFYKYNIELEKHLKIKLDLWK